MPSLFGKRGSVAVVEIHGMIGGRVGIATYSRLLETIARSKRYRALLLDVDSPGGSSSGSEVLYHAIKGVSSRKPVVAYVRGMGASGAYYLCCAASQVFALPTALIGSIGVIYLRPVLEQLLSKVGVEFSVFKSGDHKDMTGFWRSPTKEEEGKLQGLIGEIHENFLSVVSEGRSIDKDKVRELATGELFTARRGHELGMLDRIGGMEEALESAAALGNCRPRPHLVRPKRSFTDRLMDRSPAGQGTIASLGSNLTPLLSGGMYYLEPSSLLSDYYSG